MSMRTFLALDLEDVILDALEGAAKKFADPAGDIRWTSRDNLHVTLHFLGDVADEKIHELCGVVSDACEQIEPFDFDVQGMQAVPPSGPLHMIWANIADPTGELAALHEMLGADLANMGLRIEQRRFKPHITLARIKGAGDCRAIRQVVAEDRGRDFGRQHAAEAVLYASQLTPDGPIYTPLARAPLG